MWQWIAFAYFAYLAAVALIDRRFSRARWRTLVAALLTAAWTPFAPSASPWTQTLLPLPILLAGYWLSGLFFVRPMHPLEQWLLRVDAPLLPVLRRCPRALCEYFELAYLLVYAVVPAGALTLLLSGHANEVPRFWAIVLLSEFISYGMLPWLQTRPPRVIEADPGDHHSALRRFNLAVLGRGSIQVNTIPSGHAAGSVAVALAVGGTMPMAGSVFALLAASIVVATVVGRYQYLVDSVLGVLVAIAAWSLVSPA